MKLLLEFFSSFAWVKKHNVDIVILHENNDFLDTLNLNNIKYVTLGIYPEKTTYFLNKKILAQVLKFFFTQIQQLFINGPRYFLRLTYIHYIKTVIDFMSPYLVITYIDNSGVFQEILQKNTKRRYIAIQNSVRNEYNYKYSLKKTKEYNIEHDIYFCFGEQVKDCFEDCGHSANEYIFSGGPLKLSKYLASDSIFLSPHEKEVYDLCIVSQWIARNFIEENSDLNEEARSIRDATDISLNLLNSFQGLSEIKLIICLRSGTDEEKSYYLKKLDKAKDIFFISNSYSGINQSKVIFGISSTLLIEAFSLKKKVIWCNPLNHKYHKVVSNEAFYINSSNEMIFSDKLDKLFSLSTIEFEKKSKQLRRYLADLNLYNLPSEKLENLIAREISRSNQ